MNNGQMMFPYLKRDRNRHGKDRVFVRLRGRHILLHAKEDTPEFAVEYGQALARLSALKPKTKAKLQSVKAPKPGTMGALKALYCNPEKTAAFAALDPTTQLRRRAEIERCLETPHNEEPMKDCPVRLFTSAKVRAIREAVAHRPGVANNRLKHLSAFCGWAAESGHMASNPCREVKRIKTTSDGWHTWTVEEIAQFEARWPVGTLERLAMALLRYLGVRRSDVVRLGRQHVRGSSITFVPWKTRKKRPTPSTKPILAPLKAVIDATPRKGMTFLETARGEQRTAKGFGNWFREACDEAKLPHCSAHGIRKAAATLAAEEGATVHQLMAIFDWSTPAQAEVYTRAASRTKMSADAMPLLASERN